MTIRSGTILTRFSQWVALQVAFYASGCTHMQYYRTLKQFLGVSAVTCKPFYDMIKLVYPCVLDMIKEMCDEAREDMYKLGSDQLGSYHRAVTTGGWYMAY